jgi:hypothetical protein
MMQVVRNGDTEAMELGDVVVVAGLGEGPPTGPSEMILVRKARTANNTAVIGVVASTFSAEWLAGDTDPIGATAGGRSIPVTQPGPVASGEYLLIVVQGPAQVNASAVAGGIEPGDLLSTGAATGQAAKAPVVMTEWGTTTIQGAVLGKALEPLSEGAKLIHVFVTLQ